MTEMVAVPHHHIGIVHAFSVDEVVEVRAGSPALARVIYLIAFVLQEPGVSFSVAIDFAVDMVTKEVARSDGISVT